MASAEERLRTVLGHIPAGQRPPAAGAAGVMAPEAVAALEARGSEMLRRLDAAVAGKDKPPPRKGPLHKPSKKGGFQFLPGMDILEHLHELEDVTKNLDYDIAKHLPGPLHDQSKTRNEVLAEEQAASRSGANYMLWERWQREYCKDGMSSNFVTPTVGFAGARPPILTQTVILAHPGDCKRIAAAHVQKQPNFSAGLLGTGIIATTDNDHWQRQRHQLVQAFHPMASLAKIYPTVVGRAERCGDRLAGLAAGGAAVDISEFLLHEALAQLMLGLFGFPEGFMDATNKRFRDVMSGRVNDGGRFSRFYMMTLLELMKEDVHVSPSEALRGTPIHGPLSRVIETTTPDNDTLTKIGNAFIFAFAGHDTTGHTMTWLVFEMCKNPTLQRRLQAEVDEFWDSLKGRKMEYRDLHRLQFMTRCIMETLRYWPSVPNGTFRELQHDDWVHGEGGQKVHVPKGTYVQVQTWLRHRDPQLWGADAGVFNPDREFRETELWEGRGLAAYNPATERFSPFTYQPRDCIGKNFAHSEMRAILVHLFRRFNFELADPAAAARLRGVNYGTMGPQDMSRPEPRKPSFLDRVPVGLHVRATPRRHA